LGFDMHADFAKRLDRRLYRRARSVPSPALTIWRFEYLDFARMRLTVSLRSALSTA